MKFRAIEQTALKHPDLLTPNGRGLREEVASCKWLVWHGKGSKAVARLKRVHDAFGLVPDKEFSTLYWNLRHAFWYLRSTLSQWILSLKPLCRRAFPPRM